MKDIQAPTDSPASSPKTSAEKPTEAKPTEAKPPETKVPDKYDFKVPEGYELNTEVADKASGIFKDLGLTQDQAQRLVDFYAEQQTSTAEAPFREYERIRQEWRTETAKSDLGDAQGDLRPEVKTNIDRAFQHLASLKDGPALVASFKETMDITGVGDRLPFVRALNAFGALLAEGKPVSASGPAPTGQAAPGAGPRSAAKALYPNLP